MVLKISNDKIAVWIDMFDDSNNNIIDYYELIKDRELAVYYLKSINFRRYEKLGFRYEV